MATRRDHPLKGVLQALSDDLQKAGELLGLPPGGRLEDWTETLRAHLLPRLSGDLPLVAAICGGGSSGKSTLFNALVGKAVSTVGGRAGLNRRVLLCSHPTLFQREGLLALLFQPFGCLPGPLTDPADLGTPGCPLYVPSERVSADLLLMDTPDFDTGARGVYTNRQASRQALETADVFIYIFTNSNYNNRDNTDFLAEELTHIGTKKCFLVYRVYPTFKSEEIREHAATVAHNLYGKDAANHVIGVYRADESNAVASGEAPMMLSPLEPAGPSLADALRGLDPRKLQPQLMASMLADTLARAAAFSERMAQSRQALALYRDALRTAQSHSVQQALRHFPTDRLLKQFAKIWLQTDPPYIKLMRKTGTAIEMPYRGVIKIVKRLRKGRTGASPSAKARFRQQLEEDLLTAVHELYRQAVGPWIHVTASVQDTAGKRMAAIVETLTAVPENELAPMGGKARMSAADEPGLAAFKIPAHPALAAEQERLKTLDWSTTLQTLLARKELTQFISREVENSLRELAEELRRQMGLGDKLRQTAAAFLNVLPATAAITYILSTGDPVGAAGIKVKLTGFFGLHDLYALIAIPATSGMKNADRRLLEAMLVPIARAWLSDKAAAVQKIFEENLTGALIGRAAQVFDDSREILAAIDDHLQQCRKAAPPQWQKTG
ncbi:MAG: GTPase domain-containing protein [Desulfobacterales bacterium]